jgi:sterol desaturase/sphingolipid hydroxylase (fatty acid hydroxylase superfamily)
VIATPAFHHRHHDGIRGNYAGMLSGLDLVFGTWNAGDPARRSRDVARTDDRRDEDAALSVVVVPAHLRAAGDGADLLGSQQRQGR